MCANLVCFCRDRSHKTGLAGSELAPRKHHGPVRVRARQPRVQDCDLSNPPRWLLRENFSKRAGGNGRMPGERFTRRPPCARRGTQFGTRTAVAWTAWTRGHMFKPQAGCQSPGTKTLRLSLCEVESLNSEPLRTRQSYVLGENSEKLFEPVFYAVFCLIRRVVRVSAQRLLCYLTGAKNRFLGMAGSKTDTARTPYTR